MYIVQDVTGPGALPLGCCALSLLGTRAEELAGELRFPSDHFALAATLCLPGQVSPGGGAAVLLWRVAPAESGVPGQTGTCPRPQSPS